MGLDETGLGGSGNDFFRDFVESPVGHVLDETIRPVGADLDLAFFSGLENDLVGDDFETLDGGVVFFRPWNALSDPAVEDLVSERTFFQLMTAFVRNLSGGFEEKKAVLGRRRGDAAGTSLERDAEVIHFGIAAEERELEATPSLKRAVTLAGAASHLLKDGHDFALEADGIGVAEMTNLSVRGDGEETERQENLCGSPQLG